MKKSKKNGKGLSRTSLKEQKKQLKEYTFHDLGDTGHPCENDYAFYSEYYDYLGKP
jgi:hypothetical protein